MPLSAMRYKNYVWPHNPGSYSVSFQRRIAVHKIPFGGYATQELGTTFRVMKGEGEFAGEGAYEEFRRLADVFADSGPGLLTHPVWDSASAYFVSLTLAEEPRQNYVRYRFEFWESGKTTAAAALQTTVATKPAAGSKAAAAAAQIHTVVQGDTLWGIAGRYGVPLTQLIENNPQIKNPNLIYPGNQVRIR